jgi:glyoxylate/hydroxypyruvate reductase
MVDHIDVKAAAAKGIKIGHTPGVLTAAVSDICVMLVLMTMRRVEEGIALVKAGEWPQVPWSPFVLCGPTISHPSLTVSFLGFGRISQETLRKLLVFTNRDAPPTVQYTSSRPRELDADFSKAFGVKVQRVEIDQLAKEADILVVLCDLNPSTTDLVNVDFLKKMKKSAVLVNGARVSYRPSDVELTGRDQSSIRMI